MFFLGLCIFFFKQKTAYEMRISDWSSDVCSSDLLIPETSWCSSLANMLSTRSWKLLRDVVIARVGGCEDCGSRANTECHELWSYDEDLAVQKLAGFRRSEEHTSELQSLMRISYAVFCLKKTTHIRQTTHTTR